MSAEVTEIGRKNSCPDPLNLARFASGTLDPKRTENVTRHLTTCAECAAYLKLIASPDEDDVSSDEIAVIDNLPSARPAGRAALARRMASVRSGFAPLMRIAAAIVGLGIVFGGYWYARQNRLIAPDRIVASAYSSRRPFPYRLTAGGDPVPVRIERATSAITDLPPAVVNALASLNDAADQRPDDARVLNAVGQAKVIALDLPGAAEVLERAHRLSPGDAQITANLATAVALQSEHAESGEQNRPLMLRSLELFDEALKSRPSDTVAHFNRALVLTALGRKPEAIVEMRRCLADETDPGWRSEITRRLESFEK